MLKKFFATTLIVSAVAITPVLAQADTMHHHMAMHSHHHMMHHSMHRHHMMMHRHHMMKHHHHMMKHHM